MKCTFPEPFDVTNHSTPLKLGNVLRDQGVKRVVLIHPLPQAEGGGRDGGAGDRAIRAANDRGLGSVEPDNLNLCSFAAQKKSIVLAAVQPFFQAAHGTCAVRDAVLLCDLPLTQTPLTYVKDGIVAEAQQASRLFSNLASNNSLKHLGFQPWLGIDNHGFEECSAILYAFHKPQYPVIADGLLDVSRVDSRKTS